MPFTFAHPAAVLPVHRRWPRPFVLSALVIGSMAPDFAYLPPFLATRSLSHNLAGSVLFCVPAGFVVYLAFHLFLKAPLTSLLPGAIQRHALRALADSPQLPQRSLLTVLASLWLGSMSHLVWDAFTHEPNRVTRLLPFLAVTLFRVEGYRVQVCRVLQHASTILGVWILWRALMRLAREMPTPGVSARPFLTASARFVIVVTLVLAPIVLAFAWQAENWFAVRDVGDAYASLFKTVIRALTIFGAGLLAYAAWWYSLRAAARRG